MQRRNYLHVLIGSFLALVAFFVFGGSNALAIPPAGVRILFFDTPNPIDNIARTAVILHRPVELITLNGLSRTDSDFSDNLEILNGQTVNPGEQIAVTHLIWFDENVSSDPQFGLPSANSSQPWQDVYDFISNPKSNAFAGGQEISRINQLGKMVTSGGFSSALTSGLDPHASGVSGTVHYGPNAAADNTGRPDIITSATYTIPEPITGIQTRFDVYSALYYDYDFISGSSRYRELDFGESYFFINPRVPKFEVRSGDIFVGSGLSDRLVPTGPAGQVITSGTDIKNSNACSWITNQLLKQECLSTPLQHVGTYSFSDSTTANAQKARESLYKSLSKAAQEVAQIETSNNQSVVENRIRNFLQQNQSDLLSKGEMLIIANPFSGDPVRGSDVTVRGKKVVVFAGGGNPTFKGYIKAEANNQVAFILLGGGTMQLQGRGGAATAEAHFDGAFVALDVTADGGGNYTSSQVAITSAGEYPPVTVNGLLVSDIIRVSRQVPGNSDYVVKINYDGKFISNNLIGLSPFLRPLVSEASF